MRRAARIAGWTAVAVLALVALLAGTVLIVPNTSAGRRLIERWTPRLTQGQVRISGLSGSFPGTIDVGELELRDARGVWLSAERISLQWSPLELIGWRLHIERLAVARLQVVRQPVPSSRGARSTRSSHRGLPLPSIDLDRVSIGALVLEPAIAGSLTSLVVSASAHLHSLAQSSADITAQRTNGAGTYALHLRFTRSRMDATLKLDEPGSGPLEHLVGLPGLGPLSVEASVTGPHDAERIRLNGHAGTFDAQASGTVDWPRRSANIDYSFNAPALTPRAGLSWKRFRLEGRWRGTLAAPEASARLHLVGLKLPGGLQLATLAASLGARGGVIAVQASADGLQLPRPVLGTFAQSPVRLDATLHLDEPRRPLDLSVRQKLLSMTVHALTAGARSATFEIRVPDVAPFTAATRFNVGGGLTATGKVAEHGTTTRFDLSARSNLGGKGMLSRLLGGASRLHFAARWTANDISVVQLDLKGAALTFSASGRASRAARDRAWRIDRARWQLQLPALATVFTSLSGNAALSGSASGPVRELATRTRAEATLSPHGAMPGTIDARLQTRGLPPKLSGDLKVSGALGGKPLALDASLARSPRGLAHLIVRTAHWKSVHVDGDVTSGPHLSFAHGEFAVRIDRLADLSTLVGRPLAGRLSASAKLQNRAGRTLARLEFDGRGISTGGPAIDARVSGSGPIGALPLTLKAGVANLRGHRASLEARLQANAPARELRLLKMTAHYRKATLRLLSPARVSLTQGVRTGPVKLGLQGAVLELAGQWLPALDLRASLRGVDAKVVDALVPDVLASGTLQASARLTGKLSAPRGRVTLTVHDLRVAESSARDLPAIALSGSAKLGNAGAQIDARLDGGQRSRILVRGRVPLAATERYDLKVSGQLQAAFANPLLEARGDQASGALSVDATVSGPAHDPEISGAVQLEHGDLRDYANGLHLADITARLVGGRGILRIERLVAHAGPGQISIRGTIGVLQPNLPIDIELKATRAQPIESDFITANANADLRLRGTLRRKLEVTGRIHLNHAHIGIPNSLPPNVAVLNVRRPGEAPPPPPAHRLTVGLDVTLDAPREIIVQGRGLDAELGGSLAVDGTTEAPQVHGGFQMIRGTFSLASTQLKFASGEVSFNGTGLRHKIDPTLNFVAQANAAGATVTLRVSGYADAPKFELSSSPPLPQDEILARLLFGESASQLKGLQVAEIGAALASLSGVGGGGTLNPLAELQKALGLNRLTVGSTTNGTTQRSGASITAGRYVSSRVFVSATQNTTGTSQLKVDVDLTKHFKLQTRLGNGTATAQGTTPENDPGSSIGLSYQFNY